MQLGGNTVLVTGGATGIGLAIAKRFLAAGSEVIICGRRKDKLDEAKAKSPGLHTRVCDVARASEREALAQWCVREFPKLDTLVNNAGIQRHIRRLADQEAWDATAQEIAINLEAPIHLTRLFLPHLMARPRAAVVNVTSGLAFVPLTIAPVYSATKAALHSFTLSLRRQLAKTSVEVVEIIPPAVNTDLGGPGLHTFGAPLDEFADSVMARVGKGEVEVPYGMAETMSRGTREQLDGILEKLNQMVQ